MKKSSQVPDQYLGYSLQATRFLHLLIESGPAGTVSLEVFEDVGKVEDGTTLASQAKTAQGANPVSDRATGLWKTFSNWVDAATTGEIDPTTTIFEIYLGTARTGNIVNVFANAATDAEAATALDFARTTLWGPAPAHPERAAVAASIRDYVDNVLGHQSSAAITIVKNFRLTAATSDPHADLRAVIANKWIVAEASEALIRYAHGWVKERIDGLIGAGKSAAVNAIEFDNAIREIIPRLDFNRVLSDFAGVPDQAEVDAQRLSLYVHQMRFIAADDEEVLEAINSFLRAAIMRTRWSEDGWIHEDSFKDYAEALITFWKHKRRQTTIAYKHLSQVDQGKLLFSDCCTNQVPLQGLDVPPYFGPGSYHALADEPLLGWHPDFEILIAEHDSDAK